MPLSPDATFQRHDLNRFARAFPDDTRLGSLIAMHREHILQFEHAPDERMIPAAQDTLAELEDHIHEQGYVWPPCQHRRVIGASWNDNGVIRLRFRCKECGVERGT